MKARDLPIVYEDGAQNITCHDGVNWIFAVPQRYVIYRNDASGIGTRTVNRITIPAGTEVADGMKQMRIYFKSMEICPAVAAKMLDFPEILYDGTA